jgi:hypothetical protein
MARASVSEARCGPFGRITMRVRASCAPPARLTHAGVSITCQHEQAFACSRRRELPRPAGGCLADDICAHDTLDREI